VREGIDFFPLTVDVEERRTPPARSPARSSAVRAARPTTPILTCRLIDRPLRPSFPDGFRNETQVVLTVLGADREPHDVLAINAASASLMLSGIPFDGPIGAVRLAYSQDGEWIPHPTYEEGDESTFEIVVAGRELDDGDVAIMMVEAGGTEKSLEYYADGAPKVDEGRARRRPRGLQGGSRSPSPSRTSWSPRSAASPIVLEYPSRSTTPTRCSPPSWPRRRGQAQPRSPDRRQAERNAANDAIKAEVVAEL
jgi:hypothetical protein